MLERIFTSNYSPSKTHVLTNTPTFSILPNVSHAQFLSFIFMRKATLCMWFVTNVNATALKWMKIEWLDKETQNEDRYANLVCAFFTLCINKFLTIVKQSHTYTRRKSYKYSNKTKFNFVWRRAFSQRFSQWISL